MKNILTILLSGYVLLFTCSNAAAQIKTGYKVYGVVADSATRKPLALITLTLTAMNPNNMPVQNALSKNDGSFEFASINKAKYKLSIYAVGYRRLELTIDIKTNTGTDTIYLKPDVKSLKEVQIKSEKPLIQQKSGKVIYDMQADPESKANNVLDMLHKIPFITVDADGNVMLKGSTSFKVFINGKPSGMMDNNLTAILRTMPASTILRIEVITIPPSKYDAEGIGGIIDIITVKNANNGYRGTLSLNEHAPEGGPGTGTSFTIKEGKLGVDGYGGGSIYNSPKTNFSTTQQSYGVGPTLLAQTGYKYDNSKNAYFGTELSYEIDSLKLISAEFSINGYNNNGSSQQVSSLTNAATILQGYDIGNVYNGHGGGGDISLNYQLGFKANKNRLLTFSYRYSGYGNNAFSNLDLSQEVNYTLPDYRQPNNQSSSEHTFQVDFVSPVNKINIEAGAKAILRTDQSNYQYLSLDSASRQYENVPSLSDQFHYTQDVFSIYNSYQFSLNKWNVNAGLRAEQTDVDASFVSTGTGVHQNYLNIVPSLSANRQLGAGSLSVSFNQRLRRPGINRLNPFVSRSDPDFITSGNPKLGPSTMNNVEIGYNMGNAKKVSLFAAVDYIFVKDFDLQVTTFDPLTQITSATYQNIGRGGGITLVLNANYNPTHSYSISFNDNTTHFMLNGISGSSIIYLYKWSSNASLSNNLRLQKGWSLNAALNYTGSSPTSLQGVSNGFFSTSAGFNKEIVKSKLYISAAIKNPFTKFRDKIVTTTGLDFAETNISQTYFRSVSISLTYNFGRLKSDVKKSKNSIKNNDLNNNSGGI